MFPSYQVMDRLIWQVLTFAYDAVDDSPTWRATERGWYLSEMLGVSWQLPSIFRPNTPE